MTTNPNAFRPPPGLGNPHVQTVLGQLLSGARFCRPSQPRRVPLPDGDLVVLHDSVPPGWKPGDRVALLLHGLGGSAASPACARVGRRLLRGGLRVVRMDLRGAGRGVGLARRRYHAGVSDDVRAAAVEIRRWAPGSSLALVGFSLGGNVALKLAGEAADQPVPGLESVAVVAPPIDLALTSALLGEPRNRFYQAFYLNMLRRQHHAQRRQILDLPEVTFPRRLTMRLWDELMVAPAWGFTGADDYYRRCSARPLVERIRLPTLVLTAGDDPFIPAESFAQLRPSPNVEVRVERFGGHLGFVGWHAAGGLHWADQCLVQWIMRT